MFLISVEQMVKTISLCMWCLATESWKLCPLYGQAIYLLLSDQSHVGDETYLNEKSAFSDSFQSTTITLTSGN